jgi:outer membrane protein OmpA-like peptidoglycan-associated protein
MQKLKLFPGRFVKASRDKDQALVGRASRPSGLRAPVWRTSSLLWGGAVILAGLIGLAALGALSGWSPAVSAAALHLPRMPLPRWLATKPPSESAELAIADEQSGAVAALRTRLLTTERDFGNLRTRATQLERQVKLLEEAAALHTREAAQAAQEAKEREVRLEGLLQQARTAPSIAAPVRLEDAPKLAGAVTAPVTIMVATTSGKEMGKESEKGPSRHCDHVGAEPELALVLQFDNNKGGILFDHHMALADMVAEMSECPSLALNIRGFSDDRGGEKVNAALSKRRAELTAQFLQAQGVRADRMTVVGMADKDPVASNATPEGRARNRRVEVRVQRVSTQ